MDGHGGLYFGQVDLGCVPAFVAEGAALGLALGRYVAEELERGVVFGEGAGGARFGVGALDAVDDRGEGDLATDGLTGLFV